MRPFATSALHRAELHAAHLTVRFGAVLAMTLAAPAALGQSATDKAAAEALFDQGRASMQQHDFATACGLLERSQHIDPAVGTLLYLAECYEKSGRTASAWATFREAADAADAARSPARARTARERAARVEPLLSRLTITVDPANLTRPGLVVQRGDQAVQSALFNVPVPVDPGSYTVVASATGYERWTETVTVPERAGNATINVPELKRAPEANGGSTAGPAGERDATPSAPAPVSAPIATATDDGGSAATQRSAAYILGGVGVLGVAVGSYFGARALSKNSEAETHCPRGFVCDDPAGVTEADDARAAARGSNIAFAIGAAGLAGAAILYFTLPSAAPHAGVWGARVSGSSLFVERSFQ